MIVKAWRERFAQIGPKNFSAIRPRMRRRASNTTAKVEKIAGFLLLLCVLALTALAISVAASTLSGRPFDPRPLDRSLPTVTGPPKVGGLMYASSGRWIGASRFTYRWKLCNARGVGCELVGKAKRPRNKPNAYLVGASDVGRTMRVTVVAENTWGQKPAISRATAVIIASGQTTPGRPRRGTSIGQSVAFWLAWSGSLAESQIPWRAVTQVDLFALKTTDGTALDTTSNGLSNMNVPAWVSMIHQHGKLAMISIGGSNDQDWVDACNSTNISGFTTNLVHYMVSNGFDGVDIDIESSPSNWATCVQAIAQAAHEVTTHADKTPIVSTDVDQSWMAPDVARFYPWPDQFNLMYYGYPTGSYGCANDCSQVNSLVHRVHKTGHVPYNKMVLGMSPGGHEAQCCYVDLATTVAKVSGPITSIPVASITTAIPPGHIVLATTENPPVKYQILTTSGAAVCSSHCSIQITHSPTANYSYPSGSYMQNAYRGPWDCGNLARYAAANGLEGVMIWNLQEEAAEHHGHSPCFDQIAPYVVPASP